MPETILDIYLGFYYAGTQPASVILMAQEEDEPEELIDDMYGFFLSEGHSKEGIKETIEEITEYE